MQSSKKIKKGQIEDFISDSTQTALNEKESISNKATDFSVINDTKYPTVEAVKEQLDLKLSNDITDYPTATLPLSDTDKLLVNQGGTFKEVAKSELDKQNYFTFSTNTTLSNSHHNAIIWVTSTINITIPSGLRSDFNCTFRTLTGAIATFLTSGTTINAESDGDVQAAKTMSFLAQYTTNNYIISGGGLS